MRLKLVLGLLLAALVGSSIVASFFYTSRLMAIVSVASIDLVVNQHYEEQYSSLTPANSSFSSRPLGIRDEKLIETASFHNEGPKLMSSGGDALDVIRRVVNSSGMHMGCTGHISDNHNAAASKKRLSKKRVEGRDGVDHSHVGLERDPVDGMHHAWATNDTHKCYGSVANSSCAKQSSIEWFRENVLMSIITGSEGAFRVEVSQCTWLSHFPPENVFVFSDLVSESHLSRTPHEWVCGKLPPTVYEKDGDIFSPFIPKGYVREVRKAGQGYSAAWIVAQFRFSQALEHMHAVNSLRLAAAASRRAASSKKQQKDEVGSGGGYKWFMIADDDTIVNLDALVNRLQQLDPVAVPWYLSRKGWGGGGHIFSSSALSALIKVLPGCVESYFVKGFRASDAMLLKCAGRAKLYTQLEDTMTHCPASHLGEQGLLSPRQMTFHGKKDFYPPVLLTTWRVGLYYYASYCKNKKAAELAVYYSACAFGSCKQHGCTKEKNAAVIDQWHTVSRNNTILSLPFADHGIFG